MQSSPISDSRATGLADDRALADDRVDEAACRGRSTAPRADHGAAFEDRARQQAHVGLELDRRVDVRGGRVHHRDAFAHPAQVDARAQLRLGGRELGAVVHVHRRGRGRRPAPRRTSWPAWRSTATASVR